MGHETEIVSNSRIPAFLSMYILMSVAKTKGIECGRSKPYQPRGDIAIIADNGCPRRKRAVVPSIRERTKNGLVLVKGIFSVMYDEDDRLVC